MLETASGIAGPYAGRLLSMLGADVVKVEPAGGDPLRGKPVDGEPVRGAAATVGDPSPLYVHLTAGKRLVDAGPDELAALVRWADVVIDDGLRAELLGRKLLGAGTPVVSVTPFGVDAALPSSMAHDVLAQAVSGLIGIQGDPGGEPLRLPGWQAQYQAGATAAVGALGALRIPGSAHIEVTWLAALLVANELHLADATVSGVRNVAVGPFPTTAFPGGALPCAEGFIVPGSFREIDWELQTLLYGVEGLGEDARFATRASRAAHRQELWSLIRPWYAARTAQEVFDLALTTPWTVGKVMTGTDALADPHLAARGFLGPARLAVDGREVTVPQRPFRGPELPVPGQTVPASPGAAAAVVSEPPRTSIDRPDLRGVRLLEVTTAWAGPFVGNLLGSLGVDVVKFEGLPPIDGYRVMRLHPHSEPTELRPFHDDNRWFEISAVHNAVNRNKRGVVMNLSHAQGREVFLELARHADAVLCNFTATVLPQLGIGFDDLVDVNPRIVVVRMPAFGTEGPYSHAAGYGTVVEGMGGFGARFGYPEEGARISDLYWPDPVAGIHAALAVLAGIERRDRTGRGSEVDVSHMEAMWCALGEGIVTAAMRGTDVARMGNREPGVAHSGFARAAGGRWVAYVADDPVDELTRGGEAMAAAELADAIRASGGQAEVVLECLDVLADPRLADRFEMVDHPVTGPVRQLRGPFVVDGRPTTTRRPAPCFDQDTDAVLAEAGIDADRRAALRAAKVIGGVLPPPAVLGL